MGDLVSVIIPVYNVKEYLNKCIDSVTGQTYRNLQIILVDDGSDDGSGILCNEAAQKDSRITVIHQDNEGLSSARNSGLDIATGQYVCFIDSDDWVEEGFVEELYSAVESEKADIAVCTFVRVADEGKRDMAGRAACMPELTAYDNKQAVREMMTGRGLDSVTWNKLYRLSLWEDIRFPKGKYHEDEYTTYRLLWKASKVVNINRELYCYRLRSDSITENSGSSVRRRRAFDLVDARKGRYEFFAGINKDLEGIAFYIYMDCLKYVLRSSMITESDDKKEIINLYYSNIPQIWKAPNISLYKRLALSVWIPVIRFL